MPVLTFFSLLKKTLHSWWLSIRAINRWDRTVWILLALTAIGGFLRFYKVSETVMFLGDQGRDAIVVSRMFTHFDPVFIGPVMSVGNLYIGPGYYYFMLPFLWLSYPSPMGPVYAVALVGTLTIPLIYLVGSRLLGKRAGVLAAALLAVSSSAITLSRFSWNPNLTPFVGLVWFYCLYQAARGQRWYWMGVFVSLAVLLQLHYITLLAVGVSGLVWLGRVVIELRRGNWKRLVKPTMMGLGLLVLFQVPLLLFDLRHDWLNSRQFIQLLQGDDAFAGNQIAFSRLIQIGEQSRVRLSQLIVGITLGVPSATAVILTYTIVGAVVVCWWREKRRTVYQAIKLLLITMMVSLVGLSVYKNEVHLHYLGFLLPLIFLLFGYLLDRLMAINRLQVIVVGCAVFVYAWSNIASISFVGGGPRLPMLEATARAIHDHVDAWEPYTVLLISESKDLYGMNYRYYLTTDREKEPLDPEQFGNAKKLFVIWEDKAVEEPLKLPLYELLVFDVATPSARFDIPDGPTILELRKE